MARSKVKRDILNAPLDEDKGSEAQAGFDYQAHCIARLCLEMVRDREVKKIVCEYHEDVAELFDGKPPRFSQIKKRESANTWTISLLKDAILKLCLKTKHKNVGELVLYGHGRPSQDEEYSLAALIALLDRPTIERDGDWNAEMQHYERHISEKLGSKIDIETLRRGLRLLRIRLIMPHPEAIEAKNIELTTEVIKKIWQQEVSFSVAEKAYDSLHDKVLNASTKPQQPRTEKQITADSVKSILRDAINEKKFFDEDTQMALDTKEKLRKAGLEEHLIYALQMRMSALEIKFELSLKTTDWQDLKDDITQVWEKFQSDESNLAGKGLWKKLRNVLKDLGESWSVTHNQALGRDFAEGLFFDMVGTCDADWEA